MNRAATTAQVADALGLRPATVQMYARNGRIPFDTTPGGHRRFDVNEVRAALQLGSEAKAAAPARSRGTSRWLVNGSDLESWAERLAARHELPLAIRMLVAGSVRERRRMDFRADEGVGMPGWDGMVDAVQGNAWVPEGVSAWEMGVSEDVVSKADGDYATRTKDPLGLVPSETVFVFVTPRRWTQRDSWATTKRAEGVWKDVRAYDAESLEQWLEETPAVHVRVTRLLGRDPDGASDLVSAWDKWSTFTAPPLPPSLVTAGRNEPADALLAWLRDEPSELFLVGESADDAFAFLAACSMQLPEPERIALTARALVVRTPEAWDELLARADDRSPLLLIPTFPQPQPLEAVEAGHHVAIPTDPNAARPGSVLLLGRLSREPAQEALVATGLPERQAHDLALLARRSLSTLRRRLAVGVGARPAWAQPDQGGELVPLVMVGAWRDDLEGDKRILSTLTGRTYDQVEALCARWAAEPDTPVRHEGNLWFCVSKQDAWALLRPLVTRQVLKRFRDIAVEVLTAVDPALELKPERRWTAGAFGYVAPFSSQLRSSLADTLAMIATRGGDVLLPSDVTGQEFADAITRKVFAKANGQQSGKLWSSLTDVLPTLAEASPVEFLDAIDAGMASEGSLLTVFDPRVEQAPFGSPTYTGLMWALERLAWSPDYLGESALALARLAEHDPGGRRGGRPADSLNQIFLPWHPQTSASFQRRLEVIDMLRRRAAPDVAWSTMAELLPTPHSIGTPCDQPRWREWADDQQQRGDMTQWLLQAGPLVDRLLQDVGVSGARWATLISAAPSLSEALGDAILSGLAELDTQRLGNEDRAAALDALRKVVQAHRRFSDAAWAMSAERVNRFDEQLRRLDSDDPIDHAWLFASHVELPDFKPTGESTDDYTAEQQIVAQRQERAAEQALANGGIFGVWALSARCQVPRQLGLALGRIGAEEIGDQIVAELVSPDHSRSGLAAGYVHERFLNGEWGWANGFLDHAESWTAECTAAFLRELTANDATFDRVEGFGPDVRNLYWGGVNVYFIEPSDRERAVRTLLDTGHANAALELLGIDIHTDQQIDPELVVQALDGATADSVGNVTMFVYNVTKLLEFLYTKPQIERQTLARLEWRYLAAMEPRDRPAPVLHEELAQDPRFFVDVIEAVFGGGRSRQDSQPTTEQRERATQAYRLLQSWRTPPGGENSAGANLEDWVSQARDELTRRGLLRAGDRYIGQRLGRTAEDPDGTWPGERVREIIEEARSSDLERGIALAVFNNEGSGWRSLDTGGEPERARANTYQTYVTRVGADWPRTRRMLMRIAEDWDRSARQEDRLAEVREDFWS